MGGNYAYIPDKRMYAAVMSTIRAIHETGQITSAVDYNSKKYRVDREEMLEHIRARHNLGLPKKKNCFKYYVAVVVRDYHYLNYDMSSFRSTEWVEKDYKNNVYITIVKATTERNAINRLIKDNPRSWETGDYIRVQHIWELNTSDMAEQYKEALKWEDIRDYVLPKSLR